VPNIALSWVVGEWILFAMEALIQTSSHTELLDQFHIKKLYLVKLSCLTKEIKLRSYCQRFSFDSLPITRESSPIKLTCEMMVGTTKDASSSNLMVIKFV